MDVGRGMRVVGMLLLTYRCYTSWRGQVTVAFTHGGGGGGLGDWEGVLVDLPDSRHWFTSSFLGGRCRKAMLGVCVAATHGVGVCVWGGGGVGGGEAGRGAE